MLTRAKRFFKNPLHLLAVIVSLAVVGVGAAFALHIRADGEVPEGFETYTVGRVFYTGYSAYDVIGLKIETGGTVTQTAEPLTLTDPYRYQSPSGYTYNGEYFNNYLYDLTGSYNTPEGFAITANGVPTGNVTAYIWMGGGNSSYGSLNSAAIDLSDLKAMTGKQPDESLDPAIFNQHLDMGYLYEKFMAANSGTTVNLTQSIFESIAVLSPDSTVRNTNYRNQDLSQATYGFFFARAVENGENFTFKASWLETSFTEYATIPMEHNSHFAYSSDSTITLLRPAAADKSVRISFVNEYDYAVSSLTANGIGTSGQVFEPSTNLVVADDYSSKYINLDPSREDSANIWFPVQVKIRYDYDGYTSDSGFSAENSLNEGWLWNYNGKAWTDYGPNTFGGQLIDSNTIVSWDEMVSSDTFVMGTQYDEENGNYTYDDDPDNFTYPTFTNSTYNITHNITGWRMKSHPASTYGKTESVAASDLLATHLDFETNAISQVVAYCDANWQTMPFDNGFYSVVVPIEPVFDYAIVYNPGSAGSSATNMPSHRSALAGTSGHTISSTVPEWEGHEFLGWSIVSASSGGSGDSYLAGGAAIPASAFGARTYTAEIRAMWSGDETYTVTYHPNGGTGSDYTTDAIIYDGSHTVLANTDTPLNYTRDGFTFTGWKTAASSGTSYAAGDTISHITADVDLYAQWEANYTLEYYDGDTELDGTQTAAYSDGFTGIVISKDNLADTAAKTFLGWADTNGATAKDYDKGSNVPAAKFNATTHVAKVYAVWQNNAYTVTYQPGVGSGSIYTDSDKSGAYTLLGVSDVSFTAPDGMEFDTWRLVGPTGKGYPETAQPGVSITVVSDVTYEALWKTSAPLPASYTVTYISGLDDSYPGYDASCADPFKDEDVTLDAEGQYTLLANDPDDAGTPGFKPAYTFAGWRLVGSSGGASPRPGSTLRSGEGTDGILAAGSRMTLTGNVTVKAVWKCTLTYDANGGTPDSALPNGGNPIAEYVDDTVTVGDGSGLKNGTMTFDCWSTDRNNASGSQTYSKNATFRIKGDTVLYALYKDTASTCPDGKTYTLTYDGNGADGGKAPEKSTHEAGEEVTVEKQGTLTRTGCTFKEWNTAKDGSGASYAPDSKLVMPEHDVTLYAIWVDSSGKIVSPGTGESSLPLVIAANLMFAALLTAGLVWMYHRRRQAKNV